MRVIQSKCTNTNPEKNFKRGRGGGAPGAPVLDPPLNNNHITKKIYIYIQGSIMELSFFWWVLGSYMTAFRSWLTIDKSYNRYMTPFSLRYHKIIIVWEMSLNMWWFSPHQVKKITANIRFNSKKSLLNVYIFKQEL